MIIDLTLTLTSPYHSPPVAGPSLIVTDEGRITHKSPSVTGSPLSGTYKEPKHLASRNEVSYFPVIRSLQIVKQFRNALNKDIIESLKSRNLTIAKASTYAGMDVGAASGTPTGMNATLDQSVRALKEPIALLGGGSLCLPSTLSVSDANLLHQSLSEEGLVNVPPNFSHSELPSAEPYQLTFAAPVTRQDPINQLSVKDGLDRISVVENYKTQVLEWQAGISKLRVDRAADEKVKKSDLNNLVAIEAVMPGLSFSAQLALPESAGSAVKGAVISIVSEMCSQGLMIGGRTSRGYGKMAVNAYVDGVLLDINSYSEDVDSYSEWLENITPTLLAEFYEA